MKSIFYMLLLSGLSTAVSGQQTTDSTKSASFIGLTGGYSNLAGHFATADYGDPKSGYASSNGWNTGVEGAWFFHPNIGIGAGYTNTSFFTTGVQSMADGFKDDFDVDSTTVKVSGRYQLNNLLAGPYFSVPFQKFTFDVHLLAGISAVKTPQFTVYLEDQENATFSQNSAMATAFAFQAGVGVRYSVTKHLCVKLNADFFRTDPRLKISNTNRTNNAGRLITGYHQPISLVSVNLGIAYQF